MKPRIIFLTTVACLLLVTACKKDPDIVPDNSNSPIVTAITPEQGKSGTEVTITGANFGATPQANNITFNGIKAKVTATSKTKLTTIVPKEAGTGSVVVTVAGKKATGPEFTWFPDDTRFVNNKAGANTDNDCYDPNKPCATIEYTISRADTGDLISIAAGIYTEMLAIDKSLTLQGAGQDIATGTVIQAHADSGMAKGRVIFIPEGNEVVLSKLTIRHGKALGGGQSGRGGGIRVVKSLLNLTDVTIEKNVATYGGAIHNAYASGSYGNVIFRDNYAKRGSSGHQGTGGGMYNFSSSPVLKEVIFIRNRADWNAGGMYNTTGSNPKLTNVTFKGNETKCCNPGAGRGGGIYNLESNPTLTDVTFNHNKAILFGGGMCNVASSPTIINTDFIGNETTNTTSERGNGGGMANVNGSNPLLTEVTFIDNKSHGDGGGMYNDDSDPTLVNATFKLNASLLHGGGMSNINRSNANLKNVSFIENNGGHFGGGGIYNYYSSTTLTNVLLSGNKAKYNGGGIYIAESSNSTLTNVTISRNEAEDGGGIHIDNSNPTLINCITWGNIAVNEGNEIYMRASNVYLVHCIYQDRINGIVIRGGTFAHSNSLTKDPLFVAPENGDFQLQTNSPAINKGDPDTDLSVFPIVDGKIVDLDGKPRVVGGRIDIGAYEYQEE